jgi:hypothetical protein
MSWPTLNAIFTAGCRRNPRPNSKPPAAATASTLGSTRSSEPAQIASDSE